MTHNIIDTKTGRPNMRSADGMGLSPDQAEDVHRAEGEGMGQAALQGPPATGTGHDPSSLWERLRKVFWPHAEG